MEMPPKLFSVQAKDIIVGTVFYTDDYENGRGISPFKLLKAPITNGNVITLKTLNLETKMEQDVLINISMPREMFIDKLDTNWRKL